MKKIILILIINFFFFNLSNAEFLVIVKSEIDENVFIKRKNDLENEAINAAIDAVKNGVTAVGIINGTKPQSCLWEIFSDKGSGTLIRK